MLEQQTGNKVDTLIEPSKAILKGPLAPLEKPIRLAARTIMRPMMAAGDRMIEYNHVEESLSELNKLLDENSLLVIVLSHISHSDILPGIKLVKAIRARVPQRIGHVFAPIAASLVRGVQGVIPQLFYDEGTRPLLDESNIVPLPVVTENDKKIRKIKRNRNEINQFLNAPAEEKSAFLTLAEGSVEAGRHDVLGNIRGMQEVTNEFLPIVFQKAHEAGKRVVVLTVGISGTNDIISAETVLPTWRSLRALVEEVVNREPSIIATVTLGHPYIYPPNESGIPLTKTPQDVNDKVMYSVAELKPILEKGYYHPVTREYQRRIKEFENQYQGKHFLDLPLGKIYLFLIRSHLLPQPAVLKQLAIEYAQIR